MDSGYRIQEVNLNSILPWDILLYIYELSPNHMQVVLRNVCTGFSKHSSRILSPENDRSIYLVFANYDYLNLVKWFCPYVSEIRYWMIANRAVCNDGKEVFKWAVRPQLTFSGGNMGIRINCMERRKTEWYIEMLPGGGKVLDAMKNDPKMILDLISESKLKSVSLIWEIILLAVKYNRRELFNDQRFCLAVTKRVRSGFNLPALLAAHMGNVQMLDLIPGTEHIYKEIFEDGYYAGQMNVIKWIEEKIKEELKIGPITNLRRNYICKIYDRVDDVIIGPHRRVIKINNRSYFRSMIEKMWLVKLITEFPMDILGVIYALMDT